MADTQPGQQWRHGWIPLTPAAARSKNHGKKPGKNSMLSRIIAEAAESAKTLRKNAQAAAGPDGTPPPKWTGLSAGKPATLKGKTPTRAATPAKSPKTAAQAEPRNLGERADDALRAMAGRPTTKSSRNTPTEDEPGFPPGVHGLSGNFKMLRTGDVVEVTAGDHDGKTGKVVGKGGDGEVKVNLGGKTVTLNAGDVDQKRAADTKTPAAKQAAPKPKTPEPAKTTPGTGKVSDAEAESKIVDFLGGLPAGRWSNITAIRKQLGGIPRDQQDNVLRNMMLAGKIDIEPIAILNDVPPEARADAIMIGDTPNHQVRLSESAVRPATKPAAKAPTTKPDNPGAKPGTDSRQVDAGIRAASGRPTSATRPEPKTPEPPKSGGGKVSDAQTESKIVGFLEGLPRGRWANMAALRKQMGAIPKDQQDNVLRTMMLAGRVDIEPAAIPGDLKPEERAAAITIGDTPNHQVRLNR